MLKIRELYPSRLVPVAIEDNSSGLWSAALVEINPLDFHMGETIYALDEYKYKSDADALKDLDTMLRFIIESMKVMSN